MLGGAAPRRRQEVYTRWHMCPLTYMLAYLPAQLYTR